MFWVSVWVERRLRWSRERFRRRSTIEYSDISSEARSSEARICLIFSLPIWSEEWALSLIELGPKECEHPCDDFKGEELSPGLPK